MNKEVYYLTFISILGVDFILLTKMPELFSYTYLSYIILGTLFIIVALIAKLIIQFIKRNKRKWENEKQSIFNKIRSNK